MSFDLRSALNGIFMKAKYTVDADYNQFAINQYLSKYKQFMPVLTPILTLSIPNQAHFDYLAKSVGFGWPSKREIKVQEADPIIKYVMAYYECSRLDAQDYIMFMSKEERNSLIEYYEGVNE